MNAFVFRRLIICTCLAVAVPWAIGLRAAAADSRPNVLLIVFDDLNDWVLGEPRVHAPNFQRLIAGGTVFTRAYCASPSCGPSRTALLTGVQPATSGVHFNNQPFRRSDHWISRARSLPEHFMRHGYTAAGYGKIFHYDTQEQNSWSPGQQVPPDGRNEASLNASAKPLTKLNHWPLFWGQLPDEWNRDNPALMQQDTHNSRRMSAFLSARQEQPFFAVLGIYRPHTRWIVPKRYFDLYPLESIREPAGVRAGDLDDLPPAGRWLAEHNITPQIRRQLMESGKWREAIQAYQASISYADSELGRVLDVLEKSPHAGTTILIVLSDHGYHLGEKEHWHKMALWERATKVPLVISLPAQRRGKAAQVVAQPVSLIDLYPTLLALCQLPPPDTHALEGFDLSALLRGERSRRPPVLTSYGIGNDSVRDARYRYIRYADGTEELYDHDADPHEWTNLAPRPEARKIIDRLAEVLPAHRAPYSVFDGDRDGRAAWLTPEFFGPLPGANEE